MGDTASGRGSGRHGSALVALDDERAALAAVLVLQEMGHAVDLAADGEAAFEWAIRAAYTVVLCGGLEREASCDSVVRLRRLAPRTRVLWLAAPGPPPDRLRELGVEVLTAPVNVNMLVERLWPAEGA